MTYKLFVLLSLITYVFAGKLHVFTFLPDVEIIVQGGGFRFYNTTDIDGVAIFIDLPPSTFLCIPFREKFIFNPKEYITHIASYETKNLTFMVT